MRKAIVLLAVVAVTLLAVPLFAQDAPKDKADTKVDITGTWDMTAETPQGTMTITATYKQEGETLTGKHVSEMGEAPLKGTVKGNEINYTLSVEGPNGQMNIVHKAKVDGDTIAGTAEIGDMGSIKFTAKRKKA